MEIIEMVQVQKYLIKQRSSYIAYIADIEFCESAKQSLLKANKEIERLTNSIEHLSDLIHSRLSMICI